MQKDANSADNFALNGPFYDFGEGNGTQIADGIRKVIEHVSKTAGLVAKYNYGAHVSSESVRHIVKNSQIRNQVHCIQ